jgi:2-oxoglutarate dehydrogenase E2 component (dihydrolipoamide succinyltransferase)
MSFFVKASVEALKEFPAVNAEIRDDHIVYKRYYNIGVAVSGPKGLVVPVLRDADRLSFAKVEQGIGELAKKAVTTSSRWMTSKRAPSPSPTAASSAP